jgi:hypothetical protein
MKETKKNQTQNCKKSEAKNNAPTKGAGEQTPPPAVPNRAHSQMSAAKNAKNSK